MGRFRNTIAALVLVAAVLALIAGCSAPGAPGGPTGGGALNGTKWRLTSWTLSSIDPAQVTITVGFADGRISGNGGVNGYSGEYTLGPGNAITIGQIASTEMGGSEVAMRAESAYHTLLAQVRSFKVAGSALTLYDESGNESLIFEPAK